MPYDYFCLTVKWKLSGRTCKTCGLYHASVKSLNHHIKEIHKEINTHTEMRVRPIRVAARRANELMCIIQTLDECQDVDSKRTMLISQNNTKVSRHLGRHTTSSSKHPMSSKT
ncbi:hypothetical protein JTB14_023623 [Gonioctena quinquepunctata]|nr:hypothetical protein JTB14_023623 [Gonioctena quinquepunctata]